MLTVILPYMGKPKDPPPTVRKTNPHRFIVMADLTDDELSLVTDRTAPTDPFELLALKEFFEGKR